MTTRGVEISVSIAASGIMALMILLGAEVIERLAPRMAETSPRFASSDVIHREGVITHESVALRLELMARYEPP